MFEWECPYCQKKFYSSCPERDKEEVVCIYCEKSIENPFHESAEK